MSVNPVPSTINSDAAQLRFESLITHVKNIQSGLSGFPGSVNLYRLVDSYLNMANTLFPLFTQALEGEQDAKTKLVAKHRMVDKLAQEWEIIFQLAANAKLFGSSLNIGEDISWLNVLVRSAQTDLNLDNRDFIVVPRLSLRYALTNFHYAPEFSALEIPISSLNTAWEWSVLWHELAGRKIRDLNKAEQSTFDVQSILAETISAEDDIFTLVSDLMARLEKDEAVGARLLNQIRKLFRMPRKPDWSREWVEELFEDACSVLTFGEDFIPVLESILNRQAIPNDRRHPPPEIRIRMARRLLGQEVHSDDAKSETIENDVANRIREIIRNKGLNLPMDPERRNDIHRALQSLMKKFAGMTVSLADTQTFRETLNEMLLKTPEFERKALLQFSPVDITTWEAVASQDYKKMLELALSEVDPATPLSSHGEDEFGRMSITIHGRIHEFTHNRWNHK